MVWKIRVDYESLAFIETTFLAFNTAVVSICMYTSVILYCTCIDVYLYLSLINDYFLKIPPILIDNWFITGWSIENRISYNIANLQGPYRFAKVAKVAMKIVVRWSYYVLRTVFKQQIDFIR